MLPNSDFSNSYLRCPKKLKAFLNPIFVISDLSISNYVERVKNLLMPLVKSFAQSYSLFVSNYLFTGKYLVIRLKIKLYLEQNQIHGTIM